jgi:tRNA G26 N,N-dimethylase Trm1
MSNAEDRIKQYHFEGDVDAINPDKFAFRREALGHDRRRTKMLELYAGVGYLTSAIYAAAYDEVVVVEKDAEHFRRLVKRLGRFANVRYYNKVNATFIEEDLADHLDFSAVDVDAFGAPGETLISFFAAIEGKAAEPFLLLATDGGLLAARRRAPINLYRYYLAGPDEVRTPPAGLADRFEEFQARFVERLAARHDFAAEPAGTRRNHNESVLYSAYVVRPA